MRLICLLFATLLLQPLAAQMLQPDSLASEPDVARFYEGCLKIIEGETATDSLVANGAFALAMDLLNTRSTFSHKGLSLGKMKVEIADRSGIADDPIPFAYDYAYARARYRATDYAPKGLSRGMGTGCRVLDLTLAPGGTVTATEQASGDCILVAIAQPGGRVVLNVTDSASQTVPVTEYADGLMAYAHWNNGERAPVVYTVTNPTDKPLIITLFAN